MIEEQSISILESDRGPEQSVDEMVELLEKQQLVNLLRERDKLVRDNGIEFYRPHWKQHQFHTHANIRWRYMRMGNRGGKSQGGVAEDISMARGERTFYKHKFDVIDGKGKVRYQHPGGERHPFVTLGIPHRPTKGCIICEDWDKAEEVFTSLEGGDKRGKLFQFLPKGTLKGVFKGSKGNVVGLKIRSVYGGTSVIMLDTVRSFKQSRMGHESSAWDWVHFDEPFPQEMFTTYVRGLVDTCGPAWALCTQIEEPWLNEFFIPGSRTVIPEDGKTFYDEALDDEKFVITGNSRDNPYTSERGIKALEVMAKKEGTYEARIEGGSSTAAGIIYKEFEPSEHVYHKTPVNWKNPWTPPENYTIRYAIDHHPSTTKPDAVLFVATAPTNEVFFFSEIFEDLLTPELCERMLELIDGRYVQTGVIDPIAFIQSPNDGSCTVDAFESCGIYPMKGVKDPDRGIREARELLKAYTPQGYRRLQFNESCRRTVWEFDRYIWDPKRPDKARAKDNDMMENFYRLVIEGLDYVEPQAADDFQMMERTVGGVNMKANGVVFGTKFGL
jgi:hypothetical protein